MKNQLLLSLCVLSWFITTAQKKIIEDINEQITAHEAEAHLSFLAQMKCAAGRPAHAFL